MSGKEIDNVLSGIIVLLVIVVLWKWYHGDMKPSKCRKAIANKHHGHHPKVPNRPPVAPPPVKKIYDPNDEAGYSAQLQEDALESAVKDSHKEYVKSLSISGGPMGSSHNTDNDSLGMSYGDGGDYHGLTRRKWCRARNIVEVGVESRTVPSDVMTKESCFIGMDELV